MLLAATGLLLTVGHEDTGMEKDTEERAMDGDDILCPRDGITVLIPHVMAGAGLAGHLT